MYKLTFYNSAVDNFFKKIIFFIVKVCDPLPPPSFGSVSCFHSDLGITYDQSETELPVDTTCTFSCETGYSLIGSKQRTCLPLARWDGLRSSCRGKFNWRGIVLLFCVSFIMNKFSADMYRYCIE